jgi:type I restriction enzyme S subunit
MRIRFLFLATRRLPTFGADKSAGGRLEQVPALHGLAANHRPQRGGDSGGVVMSNKCKTWRRVPLVDLCEVHVDCVNRTAPVVHEPTPFKMIRTTNVRDGFIDTENVRYVTEPVYRKWTRRLVPKRGDVILTREAPLGGVGKVRTDDQIFLGQRLYHFRADPKKLDADFLLYALMSDDLQRQIRAFGSGSTVEHMRLGDIPELQIYAPDVPEQCRIGAILSAYDELMENSQRRIRILEAMARALYREWFVHFRFPGHENHPRVASPLGDIPQGWEVTTFGEIYNTSSGGTPSRKRPEYFEGGSIDWVKSQELLDGFVIGTEERITPEAVENSSAKVFPPNTVLIALYGATIGMLAILAGEAATNQACCAVLPKSAAYGREFAFLTLLTNRERIIGLRLGAAQQNISQILLRNFECVKPPPAIAAQFAERTAPLFDGILTLQRQIQNLRRTRDLLLPRLLSGQVSL